MENKKLTTKRISKLEFWDSDNVKELDLKSKINEIIEVLNSLGEK